MKAINKITKTIAGVEKSRIAAEDSIVRDYLKDHAMCEENSEIAIRYLACSECVELKEEFKVLGITVKDMTPVCNECGCNLNVKIPISVFHCPLGKW